MHNNKNRTTEEFVREARLVHGDKYDYSKVVYANRTTKVCIVCPIHGEFWQIPADHLNGHGCSSCVGRKKYDVDEFIRRAILKHGDKYDYSKVVYVNNKTKVLIICKDCNTEFWITPNSHLRGSGCPSCGIKRRNQKRKGNGRFDIRNPIFGVGINDYNGSTVGLLSYSRWYKMLKRCYDKEFHKKKPTYSDCYVCDDWLYFSNFKRWFDENYIERYVLDKDILVKGNKCYSPETCCFVPAGLNSLLTKRDYHRGKYPVGVIKSQNGNFVAQITKNKKHYNIGTYTTIEEAFNAYKESKEKYIQLQAQSYFGRGLITERVYNALIKYEVEITD